MNKRYKKFKNLILLCLLFIIFIFIFHFIFVKSDNKSKTTSDTSGLITVAGSIYLNENEVYPINIYYFSTEKSSKIQQIKSTNPNIEILDFKEADSKILSNYNIKSISLNIKCDTIGTFDINSLDFIYDDNSSKTLALGNLTFIIEKQSINNDLEIGDKYPVIQNSFSAYNYSLVNSTDNDINITNFDFKIDGVSYNFTPFKIKANESINGDFELINSTNKYQYFIVKPKIEYTISGEKRVFYPTITYYNVMQLSIEQIEKSIDFLN